MPRKPSNLLYSVDERPPFMVILVLAVQHLFFLGVGLVIPVMIMRGYGAPPEQIGSVVSLSMIAAGIATIIQPTTVSVEARFDELNLDLTARYDGPPMEIPTVPPGQEELLADDRALLRLSGFLIRRQADRVRIEAKDGACTVHLHFEH